MKYASIICGPLLISLSLGGFSAAWQQEKSPPAPAIAGGEDLPLDPLQKLAYSTALQRKDYTAAEKILVEAINRAIERDPKSPDAARLLTVAGGLFFQNGEWLNAAISFKKAEAIRPLAERDRFVLSMAYIRLGRGDWAGNELVRLSEDHPRNPLYIYWLGRIDYDNRQYAAAISKFERAIDLDPGMMRAYDNLGLCYDYLGRFDEAVKYYLRAIELNRKQPQPSPWPHLNLGITLLSQNKAGEAVSTIEEAIRYDGSLPQAHYQLGLALERLGRTQEAIKSLEQAVLLDRNFPEPHYTLGILFKKLGNEKKSKEAFESFHRLKGRSNTR